MKEKEYKLNIDPRILELLGPSLYTNIYYVLAELIANAYDADAHNVYIIANKDDITVEDDGKGMSYADGDIQKYLNVAAVSRNTDAESLTPMKRKKMGRKGVGKLAALSVSENVLIKTISNGEKSGFVLSRHINDNNLLVPLTDEQISFERVSGNGTSVVMQNPQYKYIDCNSLLIVRTPFFRRTVISSYCVNIFTSAYRWILTTGIMCIAGSSCAHSCNSLP